MQFSRREIIKKTSLLTAGFITLKQHALAEAFDNSGLKDSFKDDFLIGSVINKKNTINGSRAYRELLVKEFNSLTMENDMKWALIHPSARKWKWKTPDKFVEFGTKHNMKLVGHVLVWHSQMDNRAFKQGRDEFASRATMLNRMQEHIDTVVGRYQGRFWAWDVVNEAIDEDKGWRQSLWYKTIGEDYLDQAFYFTHDVDPQAELLYNDYDLHKPGKRKFLVHWIEKARKKGVPISAVGMQGHVGLGFPDLKDFEDSIVAYADAGVRVHITELDLDVLPVAWAYTGAEISTKFEYSEQLNPWASGLPAKIQDQFTARYVELFKLFLKHRDKIDRITLWGTGDSESWKNDFPVRGRTNYPLLFDRNYQPKPAYFAIRDLVA